jgi:hypothetical protein
MRSSLVGMLQPSWVLLTIVGPLMGVNFAAGFAPLRPYEKPLSDATGGKLCVQGRSRGTRPPETCGARRNYNIRRFVVEKQFSSNNLGENAPGGAFWARLLIYWPYAGCGRVKSTARCRFGLVSYT